jgi:hypothetical protein
MPYGIWFHSLVKSGTVYESNVFTLFFASLLFFLRLIYIASTMPKLKTLFIRNNQKRRRIFNASMHPPYILIY